MGSPGGADGPDPEGQRHFFGEGVQKGIEGLEGPAVDDHAMPAELGVPALVEAHSLGGGGVGDGL